MQMIYNVKDKPKFGQLIVFAIQQLLAIMAATLVVPVITGHGMQPSAALFGAGAGTLVYVLFTKGRSPVFLGSSFAFLGSMAAAFAGAVTVELGYLGLIIGAVLAGLVYVIIAIIVKAAGVKWINVLMPAVVIGPTVAIIGLSLAGNAVGDLQKANFTKQLDPKDYAIVEVVNTPPNGVTVELATEEVTYQVYEKATEYTEANRIKNVAVSKDEDGKFALTQTPGSVYVSLICGLVTFAVVVLCSTYGKKMLRLIPFIIGILAGYATACLFTVVGILTGNDALRVISFDAFVNMKGVFEVPQFTFLTALGGFKTLSWSYVATIAVAYVPVAFVVFAEHIADHKNLSSIIGQDLLTEPGLHRTLLGDGVGSMVGAVFGGCPNTTYGESVGCVAITRNASVATIITAAISAIFISFVSPFVAFVNSIPSCVMGGVCVALYGFIAVSGLKMVQKVDLEKNRNLFVVSTILIIGIGGLVVSFGQVTITTIACALILGILVNVMLSKKTEEDTAE